MAYYITREKLEALFPESFESVVEGEWVRALDGVDGYINSFLSARYAVPTEVTPFLERIAIAVARHDLEGSLTGYDQVKAADLRKRFEDARNLLDQIRDGKLNIWGLAVSDTGGVIDGVHEPDGFLVKAIYDFSR